MTTPHKAKFGTISHGTLAPLDLADAFVTELEYLTGDAASFSERALIERAREALEDEDNVDLLFEIVAALEEALQDHAPAYGYFGTHEGDGSDFGFWLGSDALECFDGLRVSDTSEVPADYVGEVLHVNDHGNATLYAKDAGSNDLREVWSIV